MVALKLDGGQRDEAADVARVCTELPARMTPAQWQALQVEGEALGLERLTGPSGGLGATPSASPAPLPAG